MRSLMTSSKNLWTFTVGILKTCMSELSSAQTIPTVSVMFYNITPSKSLSGSTPIDSHLCIKTKYGFVTENNMASLIYTTSAMLPCPVQANLRLTVIQRDPNCQYFFKESQLTWWGGCLIEQKLVTQSVSGVRSCCYTPKKKKTDGLFWWWHVVDYSFGKTKQWPVSWNHQKVLWFTRLLTPRCPAHHSVKSQPVTFLQHGQLSWLLKRL